MFFFNEDAYNKYDDIMLQVATFASFVGKKIIYDLLPHAAHKTAKKNSIYTSCFLQNACCSNARSEKGARPVSSMTLIKLELSVRPLR